MPPSTEQDQWVERVLGIHVASSGGAAEALRTIDAATLAAMTSKASKLADAPRPTELKKLLATDRLLALVAGQRAPADPMDMPAHVASLLPGFFAAVETERPVSSKPLGVGEKLDGQDHILGIADLFAAVQRSLIAWEDILSEAEHTDKSVDKLEGEGEQRDATEYADTLGDYNTQRAEAFKAEARALPLLEALQSKFNSLSSEQQDAAVKQAADA